MVVEEVETFSNAEPWWDRGDEAWHRVLIRVGVDTNPPDPTTNAMMYFRVIETTSPEKEGKYSTSYSGKRIYLKHKQFIRLAMLMILSRQFWSETFPKGTKYTKKKVLKFVEVWKTISDKIATL